MAHIKLYTGLAGDNNKIDIEWFDHNNRINITKIEVNIKPQDKPRTMEILINGVKIVEIPPKEA